MDRETSDMFKTSTAIIMMALLLAVLFKLYSMQEPVKTTMPYEYGQEYRK